MEIDSKENMQKDIAIRPHYITSFHGETWYKCPTCYKSFEFYSAYFNKNCCPHCNQLIDFR